VVVSQSPAIAKTRVAIERRKGKAKKMDSELQVRGGVCVCVRIARVVM
jgi:hypothetical protein